MSSWAYGGEAINAAVEKLRSVLGKYGGVRLAILFGSWARGEGSPLSDVDLAFIGEVNEALLIMEVARTLGVSVDRVDLVDASKAPLRVLKNVLANGVLIYEDGETLKQLYSKVLNQYPEINIAQKMNLNYSLSLNDSVDETLLLDLANNLASKAKSIKEFTEKHTVNEVRSSVVLDSALRWLVYEAVQSTIDSCTHIVASLKLGVGETYKDSTIILVDMGIVDENLGRKIIEYITLRNRLAHRYRLVQADELYEKAVELVREMAPRVREWIYQVIRKYKGKKSRKRGFFEGQTDNCLRNHRNFGQGSRGTGSRGR